MTDWLNMSYTNNRATDTQTIVAHALDPGTIAVEGFVFSALPRIDSDTRLLSYMNIFAGSFDPDLELAGVETWLAADPDE